MTAKYGLTQDGRRSEHTLDNTGPRRFVVYESDQLDKDTQAAILLHLADRAPLSLVVDSGGKSLHGWFYCHGKTDDELRGFFAKACSLGADPGPWSKSQMVRMPGGTRNNGKHQSILYFNPHTIPEENL
jgi:hypothetical protein